MGSGLAVAGTFSYHWSGPPGDRWIAVGVAISARLSECVRHVTPVDERILHIRFEHTSVFMTVLAVYAPRGPRVKR